MAGSKKPRISTPESDEEYESDESASLGHQTEIQATFEGRNPEGQDYHGIKQLLHQLFLTANIDVSQMSDMLIAQAGIGSVLKQSYNDSDDEEDVDMVNESDVFGITSVVNLKLHKETPCVQQFLKMIKEELQCNVSVQKDFNRILKSSTIGLIINERFVNIPSQIAYPMLNALQDELLRMKKKNSDYHFQYYIMVCKIWKPNSSDGSEVTFSNDEEEIFQQNSEYYFSYSVAGTSDTGLTGKWQTEDKTLLPYRTVILFKADKFPIILNQIQHIM